MLIVIAALLEIMSRVGGTVIEDDLKCETDSLMRANELDNEEVQ